MSKSHDESCANLFGEHHTMQLMTLDKSKKIRCDMRSISLPYGTKFSAYALDRKISIEMHAEVKKGRPAAIIILMISAGGHVSAIRYAPTDVLSLKKPEPMHKVVMITDWYQNRINVAFHTAADAEEVLDLVGYELVHADPTVVYDEDGFITLGRRCRLRNYQPLSSEHHQIRVRQSDLPELEDIVSSLVSSMSMLIDGKVSVAYETAFKFGYRYTRADMAMRMSLALPCVLQSATELGLDEYAVNYIAYQVISSLDVSQESNEVPDLC